MRYVGHLMKFEDEQPFFYESAMNSEPVQKKTYPQDATPCAPPASQPYNPFEQPNEFTQSDFGL